MEDRLTGLETVLNRIRGEFTEMPGLRLTLTQAQKLWGLRRIECEALLGALVDARFLMVTPDKAFIRADRGELIRQSPAGRRGAMMTVA